MSISRLNWFGISTEYRNWILKSNEEQAVIHRITHTTILLGIGASVIYGRKYQASIYNRSSFIGLNRELTHPNEFELSSMNHVDQLVEGGFFIVNQILNANLTGNWEELRETVRKVNRDIAA
jgi:hypothetical protein